MPAQVLTAKSGSATSGAVTHSTAADASWIDIVLADDEWVRQEFDELIAHGWGGSGASPPPTTQGAHEPRRYTPQHRPSQQRFAVTPGPAHTSSQTAARAPPTRPPIRTQPSANPRHRRESTTHRTGRPADQGPDGRARRT